jgi:hypothetical protein
VARAVLAVARLAACLRRRAAAVQLAQRRVLLALEVDRVRPVVRRVLVR